MTDIQHALGLLSIGVFAYFVKSLCEAYDSYWSGQCLKKEAERQPTEPLNPPTDGDEWKKV